MKHRPAPHCTINGQPKEKSAAVNLPRPESRSEQGIATMRPYAGYFGKRDLSSGALIFGSKRIRCRGSSTSLFEMMLVGSAGKPIGQFADHTIGFAIEPSLD
ncbi:hypothetical protein GGD65_007896 [Bradyrhizobium sp. CIR18]|nr:hypothetical protein [Bradyrhizobium sp. CIR18]